MQIVSGIGIIPDALTNSYCDELVRYFYKRTDLWIEGRTLEGEDRNKKDAYQMMMKDTDHESDIYKFFRECLLEYLQKIGQDIDWDYRTLFVRGMNQVGLKIQRYIRNEGHYKALHQERDGTSRIKRMFVSMVYLNTVEDGGETIFPYFDVSVQPVQGTVVIWPAGMPYLHCGEIPLSEHKFIATSWFEQGRIDE